MKQLILIAGLILAMSTKLLAQDDKGIEVKNFQTQGTESQQENHQFDIVAHENVNVDLEFTLKTEDNINVVVTDTKDKVVLSKKFQKKGKNKLAFTMEEEEKYTIMLNGSKQSNLIVSVSED